MAKGQGDQTIIAIVIELCIHSQLWKLFSNVIYSINFQTKTDFHVLMEMLVILYGFTN